MCQLVLGS